MPRRAMSCGGSFSNELPSKRISPAPGVTKRETAFSGERQTITLRGIVRAEDVTFNNTVLSYNVADATIQIVGKGTVSDSAKKGWFNRIWDKINPL